MKLMKEVSDKQSAYVNRLEKIAEQIDKWLDNIAQEKRLGLEPFPVMEADPYNRGFAGQPGRMAPAPDDSIDFTPQPNVERPQQGVADARTPSQRIHLIYNPTNGRIEKVVKTPLRSRPPADYMEANADQIHSALKHLEMLNPKLADALVRGNMSVWVPRAEMANTPSNVKHLGLHSTGTGPMTTKEMTPQRLAAAQKAAGAMSLAK